MIQVEAYENRSSHIFLESEILENMMEKLLEKNATNEPRVVI